MSDDTCKAKFDDVADRRKGKRHHSMEVSKNAIGLQTHESSESGNSVHKRLKSVNGLALEIHHRDKPEANDSSQTKKTLRANRYHDIFRTRAKVKASGAEFQAPSKDPPGTEGLVSETIMNGVSVIGSTVSMHEAEKVAEGVIDQEGFNKQTEKNKSKCIYEIERSIRQLLDRQLNEEKELQKQWQARKGKLEKSFQLESKVIHSITVNSSPAIRINKLKVLEVCHKQKLHELESEMCTEVELMRAKHQIEREDKVKEGIRKMNELIENKEELGLEEMVPIKSSWEEENANMHRSDEPQTVKEDNSASVEVAVGPIMCDNGAISESPNAVQLNHEATAFGNFGKRKEDSEGAHGINHAESVAAAEEAGQIANSKNDQLSVENSTLQTQTDARKIDLHNDTEVISGSVEVAVDPIMVENADVHRSVELRNDTEDKFGTDEVATDPIICDNGAISESPNVVQDNDDATTFGNRAKSAVAVEEVGQSATCEKDQLSTENPTLQTETDANEASEQDPAARTEQNEEVGSFTHIEPMYSPCTMNPSAVQAVTNQHQLNSLPVPQENAIASARLLDLTNENVRTDTSEAHNASDRVLQSLSIPLDSGVACSISSNVPANLLMAECNLPPEASIQSQEDVIPSNRGVDATSQRQIFDGSPYNSHLQNQSQFASYMASRSVLPSITSQEFDPLQKEFERICAEANQISKNHQDTVASLKSACDNEIVEMAGKIRSKYESRIQEAQASFIEKKTEVDCYQWKIGMNIKLAEAFRHKFERRQAAAAAFNGLTQQQQLFLEPHQLRRRTVASPSVLPL